MQKDNSAFEFAGFPYESDTSGIESTAFSKYLQEAKRPARVEFKSQQTNKYAQHKEEKSPVRSSVH